MAGQIARELAGVLVALGGIERQPLAQDIGRQRRDLVHLRELRQRGADRRAREAAEQRSLAVEELRRQAVVEDHRRRKQIGPQFWDGRTDSLWSQALAPPEGSNEEASSRLAIAHFLAAHYATPYADVFGAMPDLSDATRFPAAGKPGDPAWDGMLPADQTTINQIFSNYGKAIEAYERRLVSPAFRPSAFDQFLAGDAAALSPQAIAGATIFIGRGGCQECHRGPLFSDFQFHNIGAPQQGDHVPAIDTGRAAGIPILMASIFNRSGTFSDRAGGHQHR